MDDQFLRHPWRVGRKVGRTIYAHRSEDPDSDGVLIGVMDSAELAAAVVNAHNRTIGHDVIVKEREADGAHH